MSNSEQLFDLEKKFLSYLFSDKKYIAFSMDRIKKEYLPSTNILFRMIIGYYSKYKNVISDDAMTMQFTKHNVDSNTLIKYKTLVEEIKNNDVKDDAEFAFIQDEIIEHFARRELLSIAEIIISNNPNTCNEIQLKEIQKKINQKLININSTGFDVSKEGSISSDATSRFENYRQIKENPDLIVVMPTGFKTIDDAEGGFRPEELIYVIGRKGDGKSVLLLQFGYSMWVSGKNVLLFSLEISKADYERRFDAKAAGVASNGLKRGTLDEREEKIYKVYIDNLKENKSVDGKDVGQFYTVDAPRACTPAFVESKTLEIEQKLGIEFDAVIIDYSDIMVPNIMTDVKRDNFGQIALDLKRFAREKHKVVISAAQMTRSGKADTSTKNGHADSSHVANSDQIADHIDWGLAIRSTSENSGIVESFKTRDAAPFEFRFEKKFTHMSIIEQSESEWENLDA